MKGGDRHPQDRESENEAALQRAEIQSASHLNHKSFNEAALHEGRRFLQGHRLPLRAHRVRFNEAALHEGRRCPDVE